MTYTPTREALELAALACGKTAEWDDEWREVFLTDSQDGEPWQPHLPTTQGKADLLDMINAIPVDIEWHYANPVPTKVSVNYYFYEGDNVVGSVSETVKITNGNKHSALMEAVIKVAAQIGANMKGGT